MRCIERMAGSLGLSVEISSIQKIYVHTFSLPPLSITDSAVKKFITAPEIDFSFYGSESQFSIGRSTRWTSLPKDISTKVEEERAQDPTSL